MFEAAVVFRVGGFGIVRVSLTIFTIWLGDRLVESEIERYDLRYRKDVWAVD